MLPAVSTVALSLGAGSASPLGLSRFGKIATRVIFQASVGFQFQDGQPGGRNQTMTFVRRDRSPDYAFLFCFRRQGLAIVVEQQGKLLNENFLGRHIFFGRLSALSRLDIEARKG